MNLFGHDESSCCSRSNQRKVVRGGSWKDVICYKFQPVIMNMLILQEVTSDSELFKIIWEHQRQKPKIVFNQFLYIT